VGQEPTAKQVMTHYNFFSAEKKARANASSLVYFSAGQAEFPAQV